MSNSNRAVRNKFLLTLGFAHPASSSKPPLNKTIPQSCLGDVKVKIEPLKNAEEDVMSGLDDSIHSDTSMATESTESESSVSSSVCSRCSSPPIHIHSSKHNLKRSRSGLQKSHYPPSRVSFNESVKVLPIPLRHEYSTRIRSLMYSNAQELYRNASRNTKEFMSEGWSVDGVVEENRMITWGGDLVHPVHFVGQG